MCYMTLKRTPGPWIAEVEEEQGDYKQYTIEPHVARIFYVNVTGEGNARLIAAAPALEELAEAVVQAFSLDGQHNTRTAEFSPTELRAMAVELLAEIHGSR